MADANSKKTVNIRESYSVTEHGVGVHAWGPNYDLIALGGNNIMMSSATDTMVFATHGSVCALTWFEKKKNRPRVTVGYVGEDLQPNKWYRLDNKGRFQEVKDRNNGVKI